MSNTISRRGVLVGSLAAGTAAWFGGPALQASAEGLAYDGPEAFDVAEKAYLDIGFENNEAGGYAWGASYYLLGLLRMYEAHGDTDYLDRFGRYADLLLKTTDSARGVTDYAGRSGPVWRTSGAYTASHGTIQDGEGRDLVQLRWAWSQPQNATAEISEVSGDTFTLTLRNPATTTVVTLSGVNLDPASEQYVVDQVNAAYDPWLRWTAKDLREQAEPAAAPPAVKINFVPQFYVFAVHTGMVTYPLAKYARIVLGSKELSRSRHGGRARRVLAQVKRAVAFHDREFHLRPDGAGDYVWPKGAPVPFDGLVQPYNQSHGLGLTMAELYRVTKLATYRDRVRALLESFRSGITAADNGAYVWPYWTVDGELYNGYTAEQELSTYTPYYGATQQFEDISHAAISVEFAKEAHDAEVADWSDQLPHFATTFTENVIRSETEVWYRVDGTADAVPANAVQCARWMLYAEYDNAVYEQSLRVYDAVALEPSQGSHALGIGYLNWAKERG